MATSVFNPDADPESTSFDGSAGRLGVDETWSTIRSGAGNASGDSSTSVGDPTIKGSLTANQFQRLSRGILLFDTSALSGGTVTDATLEIYVTAVDTTFQNLEVNISASNPASNTAIASSDYGNVSDTQFSTAAALSSFTTSAYNSFTLNAAGIAAIDTAGVSKFALRWDKDITNTAVTHAGTTNESTIIWQTAEGANPPKLTVTYTPAPSSGGKGYATFI